MKVDEKQNYLAYIDFLKELKIVESKGVGLFLEGEVSEPETIAKACIFHDEVTYTQNYIEGPDGKHGKLNFTKKQTD